MRIAMVGPFGFHPKKTMRSRALQLAKPLVQRGHSVRLIMPPWHTPDQADRLWTEDSVEIRYISLNGGLAGIARRLIRETLAWNPGVVHAFKPKAYSGLLAWWLWHFHRRKLRLVVDTDDWEGWGGWNEIAAYSPLQKRFFAWQESWGLRHNHALTVASRTLESLAWANGVPPQRVFYIPNGPGICPPARPAGHAREELGLADRPLILLYSRLFEFDTARLVAILRQVKAALPNLALLHVGASLDPEETSRFEGQLAAADLADAYLSTGWLPEEKLPDILAAADVGLYLMEDNLLNRAKCPVKLADLLQAGLPVVAEAVGQVPEYVLHQQTGLLRPSGDNVGLAQDLVALLSDKPKRDRFSAAARAHLHASFNWSALAALAEQAYSQPYPALG